MGLRGSARWNFAPEQMNSDFNCDKFQVVLHQIFAKILQDKKFLILSPAAAAGQ